MVDGAARDSSHALASASSRSAPFAIVLVVVVVLLGAVLRLLGTFSLELWGDEALWANRLLEGDVGWIRPAGYMALTKALLSVHNSEPMLRLLSTLPAIAQLPLLWLLLRRLVAPAVATGATLLLAVHPVAVAMAKEFKPYALESFLHTALLLLAVQYIQRPRTRTLAGLVLVAALSPPLAWTPVFVFPGAFLAVGWVALRARRHRDVLLAVLGCIVTLAVLAFIFVARLQSANTNPDFWGGRYDVFFLEEGLVARLSWLVHKTNDLLLLTADLSFPAALRPVVAPLFAWAVALLAAAGVLSLPRSRSWEQGLGGEGRSRFGEQGVGALLALVFVLPWGVLLLFNQLGQWPYGAFRTNMFALAYTVPFVAFGFDAVWRALAARNRRAGQAVAASGVLALVCVLPFSLDDFSRKGHTSVTEDAAVRQALSLVRAVAGEAPAQKVRLLLDGQGGTVARYYLEHHPAARAQLRSWVDAHAEHSMSVGRDAGYQDTLQQTLEETSRQRRSLWIIVAKASSARHTARVLRSACVHAARKRLRGTDVFFCGHDDDVPASFLREHGGARLEPPDADEDKRADEGAP